MRLSHVIGATIGATLAWAASPARATWSICISDTATGEVAVGTVTCLNQFDLLAIVPVVVVGEGAAACQAAGDFDGQRRPIIFDGLMQDTPPADILELLGGVGGHQSRQYGITDTAGGAVTFSGSQNFQWAGGVTGTHGTFVYAIQGNILAGGCVVPAIEQAVLGTPGDIPARLMAGMQAAAATGGDGRCSCDDNAPESCGCPVFVFEKSGHIGGMIVARVGDGDDGACNASGCADGDYFMRLNVAFQADGQPDPVAQLQVLFDAWRADLVGRPDAMRSTVSLEPPALPPNGASTATMIVTLRDWQQQPIAVPASLTVEHAPGSAGSSSIGVPIDMGAGVFHVPLTAGTDLGADTFDVVADDGIRPVQLAPPPGLTYQPLGDLDGDGLVGTSDLLALLAAWGPCPAPPETCLADLDASGNVSTADLLGLLAGWR